MINESELGVAFGREMGDTGRRGLPNAAPLRDAIGDCSAD